MKYDIYQIVNIRGILYVSTCLAHLNDAQELEDWRKSHEAIKGQYVVQLHLD